jgi:hypothetical protein
MKINSKEFQQIIKEEALRLKRKMMLEAERATILKKLQEMDEFDMGADTASGVQIKPEVENAIEKKAQSIASNITPDQAARVTADLEAAGLMGGSLDQIQSKVEEMLPINESMMNEAWDKNKIYNWLIGGGIGSAAAGLISTILGVLPLEQAVNLADFTGAEVTPTPAIISGLIAMAIGAFSLAIGRKGKDQLATTTDKGMNQQQADAIIAARKARDRKMGR